MTSRTRQRLIRNVQSLCIEAANAAPQAQDVYLQMANQLFLVGHSLLVNFNSSRPWSRLHSALTDLVSRCDGAEGVREDGSNIDTRAAHAALKGE